MIYEAKNGSDASCTIKAGLDDDWMARYIAYWLITGESVAHWFETAMANKFEKLTNDELNAIYRGLLLEEAAAEFSARGIQPPTAPLGISEDIGLKDRNVRYAKLPLKDTLPEHLLGCAHPQTTKQIAAVYLKAGRKFDSESPSRAIRGVLKRLSTENDDIFHIGWARWHHKKRYTAAQLAKLLSGNRNGTGGHSIEEHSRRTKAAMAKRHAEGKTFGAKRKMTDEMKERGLRLFMEPNATTKIVAAALGVATSTLNGNKINHQTAKAHFLSKLSAASETQEEKSATVVTLHGRTR